jgi:hypothetical protein
MRKLTLPLILLALFLPGTVFSQKSTWTAKDRTDFVNACYETAKTSLGTDTARYYCSCMQAKVEQLYPSVDEANRSLTDSVLATAEWQNRILECLQVDKNRGTNGLITTSTVNGDGGKFYALVIGVSTYNNPKLNLDNAADDATKMKDILTTKYTFEPANTFLLINPTRQKIISELFRLRRVITSQDNLLIFYAGHGYWDNDAKQGYWWARDAAGDDPSTWLSNSDLREQIRSIKSAHTLLISDACFSGGIFRSRDVNAIMNATQDIQLLYSMPSRRAITSGTMTAVPDRSVFLEYLAKRLNENKLKFLASQQLFDSFRTAVINNSSVVPQDGVIAETGDVGGDFIFILRDK